MSFYLKQRICPSIRKPEAHTHAQLLLLWEMAQFVFDPARLEIDQGQEFFPWAKITQRSRIEKWSTVNPRRKLGNLCLKNVTRFFSVQLLGYSTPYRGGNFPLRELAKRTCWPKHVG